MKNVLFISATHGDEGFSIKVLDELERKYPKRKYGFERIVGNPKALNKNIRFIDANLNRSAPGKKNSSIYEQKRAYEIMQLTKKFTYVIDLHGADSNCGLTLIICNPSLPNLILAGMLAVKKVVIWSTQEDLKPGPITQFCPTAGLEIECGPKTDPKIQNELKRVLEKFIQNYRQITIQEVIKNLKTKEFYAIYDKSENENKNLRDFKRTKDGKETFYPFMSNVYPGLACYKVRKIKFEKIFLSQSRI